MRVSLHTTVTVAGFIKEFKQSTGRWLRDSGKFPAFEYWQEGYSYFTKSWSEKDMLIEYIKNQYEHHKKVSFLDELKALVEEAGLEWDDRYLP